MTTPNQATPAASPSRTPAAQGLPLALTVLALAAIVALGIWVYRVRNAPDVTVGVEGKRIVEIAGPQLIAASFTPGDALAVRIAGVQQTPSGFRYDLRYMAFGPGQHDIGKSLRRPDGTPLESRREFAVSVAALIPESYSGELFATPNSEIDLHSNYTLWMTLAWVGWALLLAPLVWLGRSRRRREAPPKPEPSIAERLRGLLEQAARADLSVEERADLEQLLLAFWSQRLNLSAERLSETIESLRLHPQAGVQWSRVERWLHSRAAPANGALAKEMLHDFVSLK